MGAMSSLKAAAIAVRSKALLQTRRLTRPKVVRHAGVNLEIGDHLSPIIIEYIYSGQYEKSELKGLRRNLEADDIVMEIGAGIGFISLQCARRIGADRVFAFEANPALEQHIRRNYDLNGLHPTLEIGLLGEQAGECDFYVERDFWVSSLHPSSTARRVSIAVRPLNEAVRRVAPTFLVMDVEGGEYDLIRLIDFQGIRKLNIELHEDLIGAEKIEFIRRRVLDAGFVIDPELSKNQQLFASRPRP